MIRVFDVHGNELEPTFLKRAKGLVKKGRAKWQDSVNDDNPDFVPDFIILTDPTDPITDSAQRTAGQSNQTEVPSMLFFNPNNEPENDNTTETPEEETETNETPQPEIDPAIRKMIDDFKASIAKARSETESALHQIEETIESSGMKEDAESLFRKTKAALKDAYHKAAGAFAAKREEAAAAFDTEFEDEEEAGTMEESDSFEEILSPMTADADGDGIPEGDDMQSLLHRALKLMQEIPGNSTFSDDPQIAALEADTARLRFEAVQEMYRQTLEIMNDRQREAEERAERERKQQILNGRILSLEQSRAEQLKIIASLYAQGVFKAEEYLEQMRSADMFFNQEIGKIIGMM